MSITIIYFVNVIMLTITSLFFVGTKGTSIKRTIVNLPIVLFDNSIIPINENEEIDPHYDLNKVKLGVNEYLIKSLKDEANSYKISFYPYTVNIIDGQEKIFYDTGNNIKNIQVHFECNYYQHFKVVNYSRYVITEKGTIKDEF